MMTPYQKLKSLPDAAGFLKPDVSFNHLDQIALAISDNDAVEQLNHARNQLFNTINPRPKHAA